MRELRDGLGLNNIKLADMAERSVPAAVRSWIDPKRPIVPPEAVIGGLRMQLQRWAHGVLIAAEQDRDLLLSTVGFILRPTLAKVEESEFSRGRPVKAEPPAM